MRGWVQFTTSMGQAESIKNTVFLTSYLPISAIVGTVEINLLPDLGEPNVPAPLQPVDDDYLM